MELITLKGNDLYQAFLAGARRLISRKKYLNSINVFPVPDGDTGTNMSFLMQSIIDKAKSSEDLSETAASIATAAVDGSRGNSGIIFAEFFVGLYEKLKNLRQARLEDFRQAISYAIFRSYQAIMNPVEGTILTVLRKAFDIKERLTDFKTYFRTSLEQAKTALKETPDELESLKKNGVVDAGAEGFTTFWEGVAIYMETGERESADLKEADVSFDIIYDPDYDMGKRYCTEAVILDGKTELSSVKSALNDIGDSLIVSGKPEKMHVHIHTDNPEQVFLRLRTYGRLNWQKIDDMKLQQQAMAKDRPETVVVVDSIADIPQDLMDTYQIHMLPMNLIVDDISYLDKQSVKIDTFYEMMDKYSTFSSSQPDSGTIERLLGFLSEHYENILVVTVAGALSGTYDALCKYAGTNSKVKVFDSLQNSGAEGLLALEAARMASDGIKIEEIMAKLEEKRSKTRIYVSVKTLKYMIKGGRVGKVTGMIAKILNLKPVVSLDGTGHGIIREKAFSIRQNEKKILKLLQKAPIVKYSIIHADALNRAEKMAEKITKLCGKAPEFITEISPIVAANAGTGAVGIAVEFSREVK